jgi:V8-like Glu-specific endopeptidase
MDKDCSQRIYQGNYVRSVDGAVLISTEELADNTIPGLSGAPVVDSNGRLIGLMSKKNGKMEQLASIEYPREVLRRRSARRD